MYKRQQLDSRVGNVEDVVVAESGVGEESKEEAEERSADAQGSIVVGVRETEESEFADGRGDVLAASVVEGDEVEVEEKFGGSIVECASENDVVCEDVQTPSVSSVEDSEERKEVSCRPGELLEEDEEVQCSDGGSAVSYTHLDVYKRQLSLTPSVIHTYVLTAHQISFFNFFFCPVHPQSTLFLFKYLSAHILPHYCYSFVPCVA